MKELEIAIEDALTVHGFERKDFQRQSGRVRDIIDSYVKKDENDEKRLNQIGDEFNKYAKDVPKLKVKNDHLFNEYQRIKAEQRFGKTTNVSLIEGFVSEKDLPVLKESIERNFKYASVNEMAITDNDAVPTKLENTGVTKSFELVLDLYGMPSSKSFDPTVFLMPYFLIFFGFCMTDGGYGILLSLIALFLIKKYKPIFGDSKLMWVLFAGGLATIAVGAITGGWFGDIIDYLPDSMSGVKALKDKMMLFDPLKQSMVFFVVALGIGFSHLIYALTLSFVRFIQIGKAFDGICDKLTWIIFLVSLLLFVLASNGVLPQNLAIIFKYSFIGAGAAIALLTGRGASSIPTKLASGLYNLYGGTAYVGDTLSYLRLLALGLTSGVIANVINNICKLAYNGLPYFGVILAILIFVGGHLFNLAMGILGSFVHTLRLNYAEFFPKFFEGGGKKFVPFKKDLTYTIFNDEERK